VHHDDYRVFRSPLEDFVALARQAGLDALVRTVTRGATIPLEAGPRDA
jgi:hypothetical protein